MPQATMSGGLKGVDTDSPGGPEPPRVVGGLCFFFCSPFLPAPEADMEAQKSAGEKPGKSRPCSPLRCGFLRPRAKSEGGKWRGTMLDTGLKL